MNPILSIVELGTTLLNKIFPDPKQANEAKLKLIEMQQQGKLKEIEISMSAIIAEAKSQDRWTSRARPTFLYVMYIMILLSFPMGILSVIDIGMVKQIELGLKGWLSAIPEGLWGLFGAGYLGYSASRSYDKKQILSGKKGHS